MHCSASSPRTGYPSGILDRRDNVVVRSAAAQIAAHPVADFLRRARVALCYTGDAGHDLPGRAIAALESIPLDESGLQSVELVALRQPLDRRNLAPFDKGSERQARFHALAIHRNRAGAALAQATAFLRAGELQVLAQGVEQGGAWIERQLAVVSVDSQHDAQRSRRCTRPLC